MRTIGNIFWAIFGGIEMALVLAFEGILCVITIIGIPFGLHMFRAIPLVVSPFGKDIRYSGSVGSTLANVLWVLIFGWWNAAALFLLGLVLCITIIGIPWGKQWFKIARYVLCPFGAEVYNRVAENRKQKKEARRKTKELTNRLKQIDEPVITAEEKHTAHVVTSGWYCGECGTLNKEGALYCENCGEANDE